MVHWDGCVFKRGGVKANVLRVRCRRLHICVQKANLDIFSQAHVPPSLFTQYKKAMERYTMAQAALKAEVSHLAADQLQANVM